MAEHETEKDAAFRCEEKKFMIVFIHCRASHIAPPSFNVPHDDDDGRLERVIAQHLISH